MAKSGPQPRNKKIEKDSRQYRNFPKHSLEATLMVAQKIQDEMGGKPMNRLLLADGLGMSPSSSNFREILSSSFKYGLTEDTEKAEQISLTTIGDAVTGKTRPGASRRYGMRRCALPCSASFSKTTLTRKFPRLRCFRRCCTQATLF